ncbi:MAG: Do family serine endopeptidase [Rhodospirillales bacterium]|nr:Do family serine endopeptidase [Rhodospirillales bacterium]
MTNLEATGVTETGRWNRRIGHVLMSGAILATALSGAPSFARTSPDRLADLAEKLLPAVVNVSTMQRSSEARGGGGGGGGGGGQPSPDTPRFPPGSPFDEFFRDFFERGRPRGDSAPSTPQQGPRSVTGLGSGFIIDTKGHVVTNAHVIEGAEEITVILHDKSRHKAEVVGRDAKTDLAVLRIKNEGRVALPTVDFGDSDKSRVGDWIVAIGNPFGLGGTVTAGIISARGREIGSGPYDDYIQTDASINRGNSGGPMFSLDGQVIGVNTAIYSPSGGSIGIGFAIPSSTVRPIVRQLIDKGRVQRGWLGVHIQNVSDEIAESLGLKDAKGAMVASVVDDGPAKKSKIKAGDVILTFDGKEVTDMRRLPRIVAETVVGDAVDVTVWRDRKRVQLKVTVGELEDTDTKVAARPGGGRNEGGDATGSSVEMLGLTLSAVTPKVRETFDLAADAKGVVVTKVDDTGAAADKGIRPGDIIVEVGQEEVTSLAEFRTKIDKAKKSGQKSVLLLLDGKRGLRFVAMRLADG